MIAGSVLALKYPRWLCYKARFGHEISISVFGIDVETCPASSGALRIIACIEDAAVIKKILTHLERTGVFGIPVQP